MKGKNHRNTSSKWFLNKEFKQIFFKKDKNRIFIYITIILIGFTIFFYQSLNNFNQINQKRVYDCFFHNYNTHNPYYEGLSCLNQYDEEITLQYFFKIKIDKCTLLNNTGFEFELNNIYILMYSNESINTIPLIFNETLTYNLQPRLNTIFYQGNNTPPNLIQTSIEINSTYTLNYSNNDYVKFAPKNNLEDDSRSFSFLFEKALISNFNSNHNISLILPYNIEILNLFSSNHYQIEEYWFIKFSNTSVSINNYQTLFDLLDNIENAFFNLFNPFIRNYDIKNSINENISIIKSSLSFYLLINNGIIFIVFYIGFNSIRNKINEFFILRNKIINIGILEQFDDQFNKFIQNYFYKQFLISISIFSAFLFILNITPYFHVNLSIIFDFLIYLISFIFIMTILIPKLIKYSIFREIYSKQTPQIINSKSLNLKIQILISTILIFIVIYEILKIRDLKAQSLEIIIVICLIVYGSYKLSLFLINILYQNIIRLFLNRIYYNQFLKKKLLNLITKLKRVNIQIIGLIICFFATFSTINMIDNRVQENRIDNYVDLSIQITFNNYIEPSEIEQYLTQNNIDLYYNYFQLICPTKYHEDFIDICILNDSLYEKASRMEIRPNSFKRIDFNNSSIYMNKFRFNLQDHIYYSEIQFPFGGYIDLKSSNLQYVSEMSGIITCPSVKTIFSEIVIMESMLNYEITQFDNQTFVIKYPINGDGFEFQNKILNDLNWAILDYCEISEFNTYTLISNSTINDPFILIFLISLLGVISIIQISLSYKEISAKNKGILDRYYPIDLIPYNLRVYIKDIQLIYLVLSFSFILISIIISIIFFMVLIF